MFVAGNVHLARFVALSVRRQPSRLTATAESLNNSIQSGVSPSWSMRPPSFSARNSEITTAARVKGAPHRAKQRPSAKRIRIDYLGWRTLHDKRTRNNELVV